MDIADLLHLEASLEADRIIKASPNEENIVCIRILRREPLDTLLVFQDLGDLIRKLFKCIDVRSLFFLIDPSFCDSEGDSENIGADQLGTVRLGCRNSNLRPCIGIHDMIRFSCDR